MTKHSVKILPRPEAKALKPSRTLGKTGATLWASITAEYDMADAGGRELLLLACQALDRAEALREQIDKEGEIVSDTKGNLRDHPGLKHELQNRSFVSKVLARLNLEEPKPIGRPPMGGRGVTDAYIKKNVQAVHSFRPNGDDT